MNNCYFGLDVFSYISNLLGMTNTEESIKLIVNSGILEEFYKTYTPTVRPKGIEIYIQGCIWTVNQKDDLEQAQNLLELLTNWNELGEWTKKYNELVRNTQIYDNIKTYREYKDQNL